MSLKGDKYETAEEIRFRLESSVVMYDGKPVYITRVNMPEDAEEKGEIARVFFYELPLKGMGHNEETRKYLSSKKFDLSPFKMGYVNMKKEAVFVSRTPVRQNRQGLCQGNCLITDVSGKKSGSVSFAHLTQADSFVDMINGKYPSFKDAGEMLGDEEVTSVAISRTFAFRIDHDLEALLLLHKGTKCGIAMKGDTALKIPPKFHFLRQEMEENRIPLA